MFLWGQTPSFDIKVRKRIINDACREDSGLWALSQERKYTPKQFYEMLKDLDRWVKYWNQEYREVGKTFQSLSPNRPIGRIIDIVYWV